MSVIILGNLERVEVRDCVDQLRSYLQSSADIAGVFSHMADPASLPEAQLCVVVGGDGTILTAGRALAGRDIPIVGVNMGKLGFLAEYGVDDLKQYLPDLLSGKIKPTERMMLRIKSKNFESLATNELAISAGPSFRMIDICVSQAEHVFARYRGDGLIVASPTGSTGYNLSAGGPVLEPTLKAIAVTPIAPHTLSLKPIVLDSEKPVEVVVTAANEGTTMIVDGQISCPLHKDQKVIVSRAGQPLNIFTHPELNYTDILANKLKWGQSPHHDS